MSNRKSTFLTARALDLEDPEDDVSDCDLISVTSRRSRLSVNSSTMGDMSAEKVPVAGTNSIRTTLFLIIFLGAATSAAFVGFGVTKAQDEQQVAFVSSATDATNKINLAFEDYVNAASTIHLRCRHRNFTRQDFRETFEYIIASGLQFKAAQFDPMITHDERPAAEAEARAYYAEHYPHVDYQGFRGFNYPNSTSLEPRIDQPFYFPIHYQEPILGNEAAIDLDYHSSESRTRAVGALFETKGPSLTDRLSLVKKKGEVSRCGNHNGPSYGVVLMHPGVALDEPQAGDEIWPKDFSSIVLCVPDLLKRSTSDQAMSALVYIHDRSQPGKDAVFLGGASVQHTDGSSEPDINFLDEEPLEALSAGLMEQNNVTAANRVWTVTVLAIEGTYKPDILFVCLGGAVIFCASLALAFWMWTSARRAEKFNKVLTSAQRSNAIVSSLFPKNVAKQMLDYDANDRDGKNADLKSKPIADLFPNTTVMFADMEGFTAWSSQRDPISVFHLLETVYNAFDEIAARRKVFKVETVGDCYVACCGLPEPNKNHALVMARFAQDCARRVRVVTRKLEVELGPETSALGFRFGLHSGPVTGGVLRGQRARFQLFGDTVNTAARIESTGKKGRIQISSATANLIREAGKGAWVVPREDKVLAKGIGIVETCWLTLKAIDEGDADADITEREDDELGGEFRDKQVGLVDWHTESLAQFLKVVVAHQRSAQQKKDSDSGLKAAEQEVLDRRAAPIEEISDRIPFPEIENLEAIQEAAESIELGMSVMMQLRNFVWSMAATYKQVPFHNFDHASHVVMNVMKLLGSASNHKDDGLDDPLARFTLVLAAIVHDADHPGVPNGQLNKEQDSIAMVYNGQSAAEQNSLDITWNLLMEDQYKDLRRTIYKNKEEMIRFRQLLVHTVLVTDIVNKELQTKRKERWNRVFGTSGEAPQPPSMFETLEDIQSERRTALLELVIQASDVSHTMQHWHIYRQWNTCLFHEMDKAWSEGRADKDPRKDWYKGEIGFFKFYILPLADRVKHSSAFGALGAELYHCAESNMMEWEMKGEQVTQELIEATAKKSEATARRRNSMDASKKFSTAQFEDKPEQALQAAAEVFTDEIDL
ncbi:Receptor-type guanylate cyclase gcy [Seminavis robusta]|uniref:Receptor-type guanylate cyclase gcy n=1 Tax=Seminavis robusta TaxID=568900 RepID=A0A9N8H9N5_9STRA|nr:Receptor-type guanylate cyclase gcy [Seminavis robusta]|eukprot:Sro198_g083980.1 Receptor-type guanylate cyclase gcy (1107) ;mRNA; f:13205-16779